MGECTDTVAMGREPIQDNRCITLARKVDQFGKEKKYSRYILLWTGVKAGSEARTQAFQIQGSVLLKQPYSCPIPLLIPIHCSLPN